MLDTVIALRRPEDYEATQGARFEVRPTTEGEYRWECSARTMGIDDQVLFLLEKGIAQGVIATMLNKDKSTVSRAVARLRQSGKIAANDGCAVAGPE